MSDYRDVEGKGHRMPNPPVVDIHDPLQEIADRLGLDPKYVAEMTIRPTEVEVVAFTGRDGRFRGPKFVDELYGEPTFTIETHKVKT